MARKSSFLRNPQEARGADMTKLERIIAEGNRDPLAGTFGNSRIECKDGFSMSVIAGPGTYCHPRPALLPEFPPGRGVGYEVPYSYSGPYTHVEVGFPSSRPSPWRTWKKFCEDGDNPTGTVYGYVPIEIVKRLVKFHGGEKDGMDNGGDLESGESA